MQTGILHTHTLVVILFYLFLTFKILMLVGGRKEQLRKIRDKTKVVDMVLGVLILGTGIYLGVITNWPTYIIAKLVFVLILIPLGIISLRKENKALALITLLGFTYVYAVAETKSITMRIGAKDSEVVSGSLEENKAMVQELYQTKCMRCHGEQGDAMRFKAKNLQESKLSEQEMYKVIWEGKGTMPSFSKLGEEKVELLAKYCQTLKQE